MGIITIIGWVLSVATALFLGKSAIDKIRGTQEMVGNFAYMKLEKYRKTIGGIELFAAITLLTPASLFASAIIVCLMSGAAALHLSLMNGAKTYVPVLVGLGALVGHLLTHCC